MHAAEVLAWVSDGAVFCPDCQPAPTSRAAAVGHDDVSPWFGDDEAALVGATCDGCRACYVSNGTLCAGEWLPGDDCHPPHVYWYACERCSAMHPSTDGGKSPPCYQCGKGPCIVGTDESRERATLAGQAADGFAWPGGYPMHGIMADGGIICAACATKEARYLLAADPEPDWRIVGVDVHWEGEPLECSHCGTAMPSAYGPGDDAEPEREPWPPTDDRPEHAPQPGEATEGGEE